MTNIEFGDLALSIFRGLETNRLYLPDEKLKVPVLEEPIWGFAAADDPIFEEYKKPYVIGSNWKAPKEWMPDAKCVSAFYFPFSKELKDRHESAVTTFVEAWSRGYHQQFVVVDEFAAKLIEALKKEGISCFRPAKSSAFARTEVSFMSGPFEDRHYDVSWSNRHLVYAAGLGTFGINRNIITEKGCCGGTMAMVVNYPFKATPRAYTGVYDNCIRCGACIERCPINAISFEYLRNLKKCSDLLDVLYDQNKTCCGKCMVGIPCEDKNPRSR